MALGSSLRAYRPAAQLESGREMGVPLPALSVVHELFGANIARGHADDDYASVITLLEEWAGVKVRSEE